jgi:hypothetical protein
MVDDLRHFLADSEASSAVVVATPMVMPVATDTQQHPAVDSSTPRTDSGRGDSDSQPIRIVPKGLRSFDEHDADFFLELLPGPRDREGLPDSIRFWKTRIEETDADQTFAVGLIYGPSGCGKSSLVKAALLPRLSADVIAVYVEATGQETELRLLKGLRKRCPGLLQNLDLKQTLITLRRGHGIPAGKKVLIVLDQFEQWLHAHGELEHGELVQTLRQCDGGQVQCIVMVRDDFWWAVSRFVRELEVRLIEGQNSTLLDLFDVDHARRVLAAFGRAYRRLPESPGDQQPEQSAFLQQSIAGLAQDGKVICVRLSLYAEMMKSKSWTPVVLKQVGGTQGVGVTFLEETFSACTSPPEHRYHQKAARAVLKALLPESGTNIRGHMRSHAELLEASGYARRALDFEDLLNILDRELRLITPTDPEGVNSGEDNAVSRSPGQKHYQLTHDYLVPSLREWLTRKQKETRRGRAELRLAERTALWNAKPENQQLPNVWQYVSIRCLTERKNWTEPQQRMMRRADRVIGWRWGSGLVVALVALVLVQQIVSSIHMKNVSERTETAVAAMSTCRGVLVPRAIEDLEVLPRDMVLAELNRRFADSPEERKLSLAYALAHFGDVRIDFLISQIKTASSEEVDNLATALRYEQEAAIAALKTAATLRESDLAYKGRLAVVARHMSEPSIGSDRFQQSLHEHLEEAWERVDSLPLMTEIKQLEPAALLGQLLAPQGRLLKAIRSVTEPDLAAVICASQGRRLERGFDHSPAVVLQRMQAFAVACWLDPKHAGYRVELGETVKLLVDVALDDRLQVIEALAGDAAQIEPDFHGAWGLKGYVMHQRSRQGVDSAAASDHISQAIGFYEQALAGQPPESFRARYLVGLGMALLENAYRVSCCGAGRLEERKQLRERARDTASEATRIWDPIDLPEWAYLAKGNAEEDLAFYEGQHAEYETAIWSFTTAANMARDARRPVVLAYLSRERCRFRQTRQLHAARKINHQEAVTRLENDVLKNLDMVLNSDPETGQRAEAKLWKSQTYLFLAELPGRKRNEDLQNADQWCEKAAQVAWDASLRNWSTYQKALIHMANLRERGGAVVRQRAKNLLDAAQDPVRGRFVPAADEYETLVIYLDSVRESGIEALHKELDNQALERFPEDQPERIAFRARLLATLSLWTCGMAEVSDEPGSPFGRAGRDAEEALRIAERFAQDNPDQAAPLLGMTHGALGIWFDRKFSQYALDPKMRTQAFEPGKRASEALAASVHYYDTHRANSSLADATSVLEESAQFRSSLGFVNLDLLKLYSSNLTAAEQLALRKRAVEALESLAPLRQSLPVHLMKRIEDTLLQLRK